jgi:hypothetical protein
LSCVPKRVQLPGTASVPVLSLKVREAHFTELIVGASLLLHVKLETTTILIMCFEYKAVYKVHKPRNFYVICFGLLICFTVMEI